MWRCDTLNVTYIWRYDALKLTIKIRFFSQTISPNEKNRKKDLYMWQYVTLNVAYT
jgi:hypothetical protein